MAKRTAILGTWTIYEGWMKIIRVKVQIDAEQIEREVEDHGCFGTVGNLTVAGGGTFAPGSGAPGSSMTVAGNLAFQSGALYLVQVNPSTASFANVTGTATLAGTVQVAFAPGSYVTRQYTILHSGGLIGTFNGVSGNVPAGFSDSLSYTGTEVILNLTANTLGCFSINQCNVANAVSGFFNNGGTLPPNFLALFGLTGGNLASALTLLSGEVATGAQQPAFQMMTTFLGLMLDPFVDGRSGIGGGGGGAIGFAPEREELPEDIVLAYSKVVRTPVTDPSVMPVFEALPGASFIVNGATPAKNSALTSAGAELRLINGVSLLAKFDGEFAAHSQTYAGTGTVRYVW